MSIIEATTVLSSKRQITVPVAMATALGLKPGTRLLLRLEGDHIVLTPTGSGSLTDLLGGSLRGAYGDPDRYVREERASWAHQHEKTDANQPDEPPESSE